MPLSNDQEIGDADLVKHFGLHCFWIENSSFQSLVHIPEEHPHHNAIKNPPREGEQEVSNSKTELWQKESCICLQAHEHQNKEPAASTDTPCASTLQSALRKTIVVFMYTMLGCICDAILRFCMGLWIWRAFIISLPFSYTPTPVLFEHTSVATQGSLHLSLPHTVPTTTDLHSAMPPVDFLLACQKSLEERVEYLEINLHESRDLIVAMDCAHPQCDFALRGAGAEIIKQLTSTNQLPAKTLPSWFSEVLLGWDLSYPSANLPTVVIDGDLAVGNCWSFLG
ncbi:uncharacterized protein F5147DRAFT_782375 [Suillus discolor]|uniref:Uncharacterized protein n=1 Tax=Suillus discolor TaxID=1912936 RepID=A0A9P7ERL0_9AGAM|nr:uncharacterized protein F5147DRAFT_782375 [Suillus discolor]KAG2084699.1 hypothetical protein F5147DRAFT_782375 [Suillus discolor]